MRAASRLAHDPARLAGEFPLEILKARPPPERAPVPTLGAATRQYKRPAAAKVAEMPLGSWKAPR
jgi:hypothetical protein